MPSSTSCPRHPASSALRRLAAIILAGVLLPLAAAQSATGVIAGRVFNPATGEYVRNARISVEGTSLQAVSGDGGA